MHTDDRALVPAPCANPPTHHGPTALAAARAARDAATARAVVWTKDAHGGPYKVATPSRDPLRHTPAGALRTFEPGFEPPQPPGPTSNFVGDAMTGEAVALIEAKLAAADAAAAAAAPPRNALAAPPLKVEGGRPPSPRPSWGLEPGFNARAAVAALVGGGRLAWKDNEKLN